MGSTRIVLEPSLRGSFSMSLTISWWIVYVCGDDGRRVIHTDHHSLLREPCSDSIDGERDVVEGPACPVLVYRDGGEVAGVFGIVDGAEGHNGVVCACEIHCEDWCG